MTPKKIFLIEDDPLLIDIYSTKLKQSGFEVRVADRGETALAAVQEAKPDLVLLDVVLPRMDGWAILANMKASPELKDIPVVILSNLGQKEEIEKGLSLGAATYLIKAHYTPSEVAQKVINLVGNPL